MRNAKKWFWPAIPAALLCCVVRAEEHGTPPVTVWQLPAVEPAAGVDVASRQGWQRVDPDGPVQGLLAGGVVLENHALLAVVRPGSPEIVLVSKGQRGGANVQHRLMLVATDGRPSGQLDRVELVEAGENAAVVRFAVGQSEARLRMEIGKPLVEVLPGPNAVAMQVRGAARFAFVPDFFGHDVLFDARETAATRVFAPAENFIVGLDEGHSSLTMLTWPQGGGDEVLLLPEGSGPQRRFVATQVDFAGKSLFVAVLAAEGIWFEQDLRLVEKDRTVAVDGWQRPFPAKWMTILVQRPRAGARQGLASESLPIPTLPAAGDTPYSDVYYHPRVPSWFTGNQWRLHLETRRQLMLTHQVVPWPEQLLAINYPRDRVRETPLDALTLVDIMRQSLGTGPCEYILDLEGLNCTRSTGTAGTGKPTAAATCSERSSLVY